MTIETNQPVRHQRASIDASKLTNTMTKLLNQKEYVATKCEALRQHQGHLNSVIDHHTKKISEQHSQHIAAQINELLDDLDIVFNKKSSNLKEVNDALNRSLVILESFIFNPEINDQVKITIAESFLKQPSLEALKQWYLKLLKDTSQKTRDYIHTAILEHAKSEKPRQRYQYLQSDYERLVEHVKSEQNTEVSQLKRFQQLHTRRQVTLNERQELVKEKQRFLDLVKPQHEELTSLLQTQQENIDNLAQELASSPVLEPTTFTIPELKLPNELLDGGIETAFKGVNRKINEAIKNGLREYTEKRENSTFKKRLPSGSYTMWTQLQAQIENNLDGYYYHHLKDAFKKYAGKENSLKTLILNQLKEAFNLKEEAFGVATTTEKQAMQLLDTIYGVDVLMGQSDELLEPIFELQQHIEKLNVNFGILAKEINKQDSASEAEKKLLQEEQKQLQQFEKSAEVIETIQQQTNNLQDHTNVKTPIAIKTALEVKEAYQADIHPLFIAKREQCYQEYQQQIDAVLKSFVVALKQQQNQALTYNELLETDEMVKTIISQLSQWSDEPTVSWSDELSQVQSLWDETIASNISCCNDDVDLQLNNHIELLDTTIQTIDTVKKSSLINLDHENCEGLQKRIRCYIDNFQTLRQEKAATIEAIKEKNESVEQRSCSLKAEFEIYSTAMEAKSNTIIGKIKTVLDKLIAYFSGRASKQNALQEILDIGQKLSITGNTSTMFACASQEAEKETTIQQPAMTCND